MKFVDPKNDLAFKKIFGNEIRNYLRYKSYQSKW